MFNCVLIFFLFFSFQFVLDLWSLVALERIGNFGVGLGSGFRGRVRGAEIAGVAGAECRGPHDDRLGDLPAIEISGH